MTVILKPLIEEQLRLATEDLKAGEVLALPTETVYGLAANAFSPKALARVFALKNRPHFDPLIVHVNASWNLLSWVKSVTPLHEKLMKRFWPGPLTLLFEKTESVPDLCTASTPYVALRAPKHEVFQNILERVGLPLAAPSANRFGRISPTSAQDVVDELGPFGLRFVVDGGACSLGIESTVVKVLSDSEIEVLRLGALSLELLASYLGPNVKIQVSKVGSGMNQNLIEAPGQLLSHYAPRTPVEIINSLDEVSKLSTVAFLRAAGQVLDKAQSFSLSETENEEEAAVKLFSTLRKMDALGFEKIQVLLGPEIGLYRAINERLKKAAGSKA